MVRLGLHGRVRKGSVWLGKERPGFLGGARRAKVGIG